LWFLSAVCSEFCGSCRQFALNFVVLVGSLLCLNFIDLVGSLLRLNSGELCILQQDNGKYVAISITKNISGWLG
jgi:hypothetical protein